MQIRQQVQKIMYISSQQEVSIIRLVGIIGKC